MLVPDFLAQLVERCLSSVHYCEDHFHIHFFNKKQNGTFSSIDVKFQIFRTT